MHGILIIVIAHSLTVPFIWQSFKLFEFVIKVLSAKTQSQKPELTKSEFHVHLFLLRKMLENKAMCAIIS